MSARQPSFDKRTPAWMRRIALFLENDKTMKLVEWAAILLFLATASGSYFLLNSQSGRTDFISPPAYCRIAGGESYPGDYLAGIAGTADR